MVVYTQHCVLHMCILIHNFTMCLQQDCLTLSNVKQMLELGLSQHGAACEGEPVYSTVCEAGTSNLLMTCPVRYQTVIH